MMSLENKTFKQVIEEDNQSGGGGDDGSGGGGGGSRKRSSLRPPEPPLKCPRCDSSNTKFCYYNNYNLTQPRHFCKACRRYWTKGGALRNIPVGGGCRKSKNCRSRSPRFVFGEPSSKDLSSEIGGRKFLDGLSQPVVDFQLGGLSFAPRVPPTNQFESSSYGEASNMNHSTPLGNLDPFLGFHFPLSSHVMMKHGNHDHHHGQTGGGLTFPDMGMAGDHPHHTTNLASSIESLSSINQDLHWRLQQQRLAVLFGGGGAAAGGGNEGDSGHQKGIALDPPPQKSQLQPILFQNLDIPKPAQPAMGGGCSRKDDVGRGGGVGGLATEWFFDSTYAPANLNIPATPTDSNSAGNDQNGGINMNWNNGMDETWNHNLNPYSALP